MSTDTPAPRKSTNKVTPRKPRATLDLRKYFHSHEDGAPIITCGYCEDDIPANPKKGMNLRRRAHLEGCQDFKLALTIRLLNKSYLNTIQSSGYSGKDQ